MNNPCEQCIVNSMCQDACEEFVDYLYSKLEPRPRYKLCKLVAYSIRQGNMFLYEDDTKWEHKNE
jgi:hypothetical protein